MKFSTVSNYFLLLEKENSRLEITKTLARLLGEASPQEAGIICNLVLGQLHPPYVGTQFSLAEKSMVKIVAELLGISQAEVAEKKRDLGDLGSVVLEGTWEVGTDPTVVELYDNLCRLEQLSGTGSQEQKAYDLTELLGSIEPLSAQYIIRIILGKLRLGFSDMTVIDALSWMEAGDKSLRKVIEHAYNIRVDIGLIATTLKQEGVEALEQMSIKIGIPIRPASAERLPTAEAIVNKLGACIAQPKLDGFRVQVHSERVGSEHVVHFFSRHLRDMSGMFPEIVKAFEQLPVDSLICEGEAIVYDPSSQTFSPFQETVKRKRKHGVKAAAEALPLKFFVFDLLYLNGISLLGLSHQERRKKLEALFKKNRSDVIQVIGEKIIHTPKELEDYFNSIVSVGLEGLVVKRQDAPYTPGSRNFNWIKLKRQETGQLEDTLDCVILGYYDGAGRRAKLGIGAFLVGVLNKNEDNFETVAKVGTGLTDEKWIELKHRCDALRVPTQPKNVVCAKELQPDVWTSPELVCLIRADEISRSPLHAAGKTKDQLGYALRFPRFMGYRDDKGVQEATTVSEVKHLYKDQFLVKKKKVA